LVHGLIRRVSEWTGKAISKGREITQMGRACLDGKRKGREITQMGRACLLAIDVNVVKGGGC